MIIKEQVTEAQGYDEDDRVFGFVAGDGEGGFFFSWHQTIEDTLNSIAEDEQDGKGGLDIDSVREFLKEHLPTTLRGRGLWGSK